MHRHVRDVERRTLDDLQPRVSRERADVLRRGEVESVDLAGFQSIDARLVVRDRADDDLVESCLLAPVTRVADELHLLPNRPRRELERTGAGRVLESVRPGCTERTAGQRSL